MEQDFDSIKEKLKKVRLIVSDIDGTLVNSEGQLGNDTIEAVKLLKSKGIQFSFATQRVHSSLVTLADILNIDTPIISLNGSLIRDKDGKTTIHKSAISSSKVRKALELAEKNFIKVALCFDDRILYTDENSVIKDYMARLGTTYTQVDSYEDYIGDVIEIIFAGDDKKAIKEIKRKMEFPFKLFLDAKYYRVAQQTGLYTLEVRKKGISKRTGLEKLTSHLGISKKQTIVIGDWYNDIELFKFGAINITLDNAVSELKDMADYIHPKTNDEDGVGDFLKMFYELIK